MSFKYYISLATLLFLYPQVVKAEQPYSLEIDNIAVIAQYTPPFSPPSYPYTETNEPDDETGETSGESYFHPTIRIAGEYTDNLFNVNDNTQSNFLTTITPGFWMTMGQAQDMPEEIISRNTTPAGIVISPLRVKGYNWINASLMGDMEFNYYSQDSESNNTGGYLSGRLQYMPSSKLALYLDDRFNHKQVAYDAGNRTANSNRWSNDNVLYTGFDWDITEKFSTGMNYSSFFLKYNADIDDYMDRKDHSLSWYGAYNYSLKTSMFLEYQFIDLSYDSASYQDNQQNYLYGGINWASSAKTTLSFKAGYQLREYKNDLVEAADKSDETTLALALGLNYQATQKTAFTFLLTNRFEESDSSTALGKQVLSGSFGYRQRLAKRLQGTLDLSYANEDYNQVIGPLRDDDVYLIKPALQYTFRSWLMGELAYSYESRDSTDDFFDYDTNTFYLTLNSAW